MYNSIDKIVKCEEEANKDIKEHDPWSDYQSYTVFDVKKPFNMPEFQHDFFNENKTYSFSHQVDVPFYKQYDTNIHFKREHGEDHFEDSARMKFERKRLPEYYLYNFDKNDYFDIAMKNMDAQNGISSDISRAMDADEAVRLFMENEYASMILEEQRGREIETIQNKIDNDETQTNDQKSGRKTIINKIQNKIDKIQPASAREQSNVENQMKEEKKRAMNADTIDDYNVLIIY